MKSGVQSATNTVQAEKFEGPIKPDDDANRSHWATALRPNNVPTTGGEGAPCSEGISKVRVDRESPACAFLCGVILEFDQIADMASCIDVVVPRQIGDLAAATLLLPIAKRSPDFGLGCGCIR